MKLETLETLLETYSAAAAKVAEKRLDLTDAEERRRKELALHAIELVANGATNPLTGKPHSWTSAVEATKDTALADTVRTENARGRYTLELAEIEARVAWARVQAAVRPVYADG